MRNSRVLSTMLSLTVVAGTAAGSQPDATTRSNEQLVKQLGDSDFATRRAATAELRRRGERTRTVLKRALGHPDLEVRLRAKELIASFAHIDLQRRLTAFLQDRDGTGKHDLPGWSDYASRYGDSAPHRKLFAEMIEHEQDVLSAFVGSKKKAAAMLAGRVQAFEHGVIPGLDFDVPTASVATILFLAADVEIPVSTSLGFQLYRFLNLSSARNAIEDKHHTKLMKSMLGAWIRRSMKNTSLTRSGLQLAERYKMNETAISLAAQMLTDKNTPRYSLPYALLTIGRLGNRGHLPSVEKLLDNTAVCHTWHNGKFEKPIQIQVRDVALAVLIHLTKQDHKKYGFDLLRSDGNGFFYVFTLGFPKDQQREAALAKWKTWSEMNDS